LFVCARAERVLTLSALFCFLNDSLHISPPRRQERRENPKIKPYKANENQTPQDSLSRLARRTAGRRRTLSHLLFSLLDHFISAFSLRPLRLRGEKSGLEIF
jgi:hypothetical protein